MTTNSTPSSRFSYPQKVLGPALYARLSTTRVLLVGAGGIGCELLKNVVLTGFGHITIIDLDTIDLSNLNRQFLFRKQDVKKSKAFVAARTAKKYNPHVQIHPLHGNIKDAQFDVPWFRTFDLVLNALDNLDARRHVNKMCLAASVALVESGTAGYLGQVQPIVKGRTECFDCMPKPVPKTFPVCTIRSTPSQPIHCIVWAKDYLLPQLFGEDQDGLAELDEAEKKGENAQEISALRREAKTFVTVRKELRSASGVSDQSFGGGAARLVFQKVFKQDVENLLSMQDMWKNRKPPTPLDFDSIQNSTNGMNGSHVEPESDEPSGSTLRDQRTLSLSENLNMFISSIDRLSQRLKRGESNISFDKDDDDALDFVTASANFRATIYSIPTKTRWEVKEMAGNIIPAIATTNAVVAGAIVLQGLQLLKKHYGALRNLYLQLKPEVPLSSSIVGPPSKNCGVCRDSYVEMLCDPDNTTLGDAINALLEKGASNVSGQRDVAVYEDKRLLYDPDFDDNKGKTLGSLGVTRGKFLTVVDEDGEWGTLVASMSILPDGSITSESIVVQPIPPPELPAAYKPPTIPTTPRKRTVDELDIIEEGYPSKRPKTNGQQPNVNLASPSKKRRLDEDGLLLLDNPEEDLDEPEMITVDD